MANLKNILAISVSLCLCIPLLLVLYTSAYQPTSNLLESTVPTSWCEIKDIEAVECKKKNTNCQESCTIQVSFVPEGQTSPLFLSTEFPLATCEYYEKYEEISCLYSSRPTAVYFEDQKDCIIETTVISGISICVVLFPIVYLVLFIFFSIMKKIFYRPTVYLEGDEIPLVPLSQSKIDENKFPLLHSEGRVRRVLQEYLEQKGEDSGEIIGVFHWRNSSVFSFFGILLIFGIFFWIVSAYSMVVMGFTYDTYLTCTHNFWLTAFVPLVVGLSFGFIGWIAMMLGVLAFVLYWCIYFRSNCYLVALDDEILFFKRNCLTGVVKLVDQLALDSPHLIPNCSYFKFDSTFKILCLLRFHPTIYINEDNGSYLSIPVFYEHAPTIINFLSETYGQK